MWEAIDGPDYRRKVTLTMSGARDLMEGSVASSKSRINMDGWPNTDRHLI